MQDEEFPPELISEDSHKQQERVAQSLYGKILGMSVPEKIKLATVGNREARSILIRDANRVVAQAVLESPRLTIDEVAGFAANRNLSAEIIEIIAGKKEFLKNYSVRLALVNNPKTPVSTSLHILETLNERDLKNLSKNRNIPSIVKQAAIRALARQNLRKGS